MNTKRTLAATVTIVLFALGVMTVAASGEEGGWVAAKEVPDTDAHRAGPEYGHFMDFFSDYRLALTNHWRENPTPEWGHSPEGDCVATASVRSDKQSKLRWFQYVVLKSEGCFESEAVRVAVTTINTGDLKPTIYYDRPFYDHLGAKHAWSEWVLVA